jgi:hypothetical protein
MVLKVRGAIVIESGFTPFPAALAALTVKGNAPAADGVPEMVFPESVKPAGNVPLSTLHVMGAVPVAASVWLYAVPASPSGNDAVVIAGAVPFPGSTVVLSSPPESLQETAASAKVRISAVIVMNLPSRIRGGGGLL